MLNLKFSIPSFCLAPPQSFFLTGKNSSRFHSTYRKRPSKFSGYAVLQSASVKNLLNRKVSRIYKTEYYRRFGVADFESLKVILATRGRSHTHLEEGVRKELTIFLMTVLPDMIGKREGLQGVNIAKVEVPQILHEIRILWRCTGDPEKDHIIEERLNEHEGGIRRELEEMFYGMHMPQLKFIQFRLHMIYDEMNKLFEMADYGVGYKPTSSPRQYNYNPDETLKSNDTREKTPPRWLENWRKKAGQNEEMKKTPKLEEKTVKLLINEEETISSK